MIKILTTIIQVITLVLIVKTARKHKKNKKWFENHFDKKNYS